MDLLNKKCVPCEGSTKPLNDVEENKYLAQLENWNLVTNGEHRIIKQFKLDDFISAIQLVNKIAEVAENEGHHPNILIHSYKLVDVTLFTHAIGGLSENDFIVAAKIDSLFKNMKNFT